MEVNCGFKFLTWYGYCKELHNTPVSLMQIAVSTVHNSLRKYIYTVEFVE